jgi:methyl-accepting chemotaxis protein
MSFFSKNSISVRFSSVLIVVVTSILLTSSCVFIFLYTKSLNNQLETLHTNAINLAERTLPSAIWDIDNEYIKDFVKSLFLYEEVVYVRVTSEGNTFFADTNIITTKKHQDYSSKDFTFFEQSPQFLASKTAIKHKGDTIGEIELVVSRQKIKTAFITAITTILILTIIIISAIVSTIIIISRRYVFQPLEKLKDAASLISIGNLDTPVDTSSKDEIGELARKFKQMAKNLSTITVSRDRLIEEINERKKAEVEREKVINELQQALAEIKTLRGIVPICSFCKQIRDDKGYWNQVESYIREHTEAEFSHGICPKCMAKHYPKSDGYK